VFNNNKKSGNIHQQKTTNPNP